MEAYLDNAATTRAADEVAKVVTDIMLNDYGNPSSKHSKGFDAEKQVKQAAQIIAKTLKCDEKEILFTSGGTESNNMAIIESAIANKRRGNHVIVSSVEHSSVKEPFRYLEENGFNVTYLPVDNRGLVSVDALKEALDEETILVSVMLVNNEIGTIEPIKEIGKIAKEHKIYFHTDAVQAVGNLKINVQELNIDSLSLSGHKFYGPKGIGVLYMRTGVNFQKFVAGGHQERNKRAGTENVPGIVGLASALERAYNTMDEHNKKIKELRDYYEAEVKAKIPYMKINGDINNRLHGNSNISFRFIEGEGLLLNLDLKGICASSGSACTSGSLDPSHVLLAIGLPHEIAHGSLRISIGKYNTKEEIDYLVENLVEIVNRLREMSPLWEEFIEGGKV